MANEQITFDKLPQAVGYLTEQMEQIRQMVAALQPQASSDKHRLIEIDEACKITRKAKPTIYTLARKGLIPAYKRGKNLQINSRRYYRRGCAHRSQNVWR